MGVVCFGWEGQTEKSVPGFYTTLLRETVDIKKI